jgi:cysteine synthase
MTIRETYKTVSEAFMLPRLVQISENLYGASFFLMKLLPARYILDRAREEQRIHEGSVVIETTSGTFGLALAILCAERKYKLILVSDPAIDPPFQRRLEDLGTRVEIVREPAPIGGYQRARLVRMTELREQNPGHFCPSQYDNPNNPRAYAPLVELISEAIGKVDCLVGPVGSGGSMSGTGNHLRRLFPDLQAIGVDTYGSVLFGHADEKRQLRGLGNSLMPRNLDHSIFDEVHWVSAVAAFTATRELHQSHALFMGGTSGASFLAARWWAAKNPKAMVVALFPDEGYRYIDTIYRDEWLEENGLLLSKSPAEPQYVAHPSEARTPWSYTNWNRRSYEEVLGHPFESGGAA